MSLSLVINGRYLTREMTGVDRVAFELTRSLANYYSKNGRAELFIALPKCDLSGLNSKFKAISGLELFKSSHLSGHIWEQMSLPFMSRKSWLLNFCNTGPIIKRRQVVLMHDAQVYDCPETYSKLFRLSYRLMYPLLSRRSDVILTVSEFSKKRLEQNGAVPKGKLKVVYNGVDHMRRISIDSSVISRNALNKGGYFLAIGSSVAHKNLHMLLDLAKKRVDTTIPIVIAGGGGAKGFAKSEFSDFKGVKFLGRVTDEELKSLYINAFALLFPSITEGFGLPALEAMFCGCPVVATTGGAVPEICGDAALYADPYNSKEWIVAMDKLASQPEYRRSLIDAGRKRAALFTWDIAAQKIADILEGFDG